MNYFGKKIMVASLALCFPLFLQAQKISLKADNITVKSAIEKVKKQSGYSVVFSSADVNLKRRISLNLQNAALNDALRQILRGQSNLTYEIKNDIIVIRKRSSAERKNVVKTGDGNVSDVENIKGKVVDEHGEPVIGASVKAGGTSAMAVTDLNGEFSIKVPVGETLTFSYLGYEPKSVRADNSKPLHITMYEDQKLLDEVVVIGYGTVKKKDLTGSVAVVKGGDLASKKTTTLSTALQGSVSGLMVRRNNDAPGASASSMHIRGVTTIGDSSPLIIVDGIPCDNIDYVNTNDVENVSVLKDAAAASIYGSKAAAGVILITTKRGSSQGLNLNYTGEVGWSIPTKQPKMVGITRYLEMSNELLYNDNPSAGFFQLYTSDQVKNWIKYNKTDPNNYPITDWTDLILKSSALKQTHTVSLSGGNKNVKTSATLSYDDVDGLYEGRGFQRYMLRANNDFTINDKLSAALDINIRHAKSKSTIYDPFSDMRKTPAIYPAVWDDGRIASGKSGANPYGLLKLGGNSVSRSMQIGGKASLTYKPVKGLKISAVVAPFINFTRTKSFRKRAYYTLMDDPTAIGGELVGGGITYATNKLSEGRNESYNVTSQLLADYTRSFGKHDVTLMLGYENYVLRTDQLSAARDQYEFTQYPYLNIGPEDYMENSGTGSEYTSNSIFGRLLYSYADRYLFQANVRRDASSRFASAYRWGTFPSFSAGWVVSEEKFIRNLNLKWLSSFKLRGSWGMLGNERIGSNYFPYMALMTFGDALFYQDGVVVSNKTAAQRSLAVEDITWETTTSTDIGFDMALLDNRLRMSFDYYWKKTKDMLLDIQIPFIMGYADPKTNAGRMSTKGFDFEVSWNDHIGDFSYGVTLNLSDFKSKIDYLRNSDIISGGKVKRAGVYFNEWYGYICEGIYQTQEEVDNSARLNNQVTVGDLKYKDISGPDGVPDGIISADYDRVPLGNSLPRYQYGGMITAGYKGFDLSVAFQGIGSQNSYLEQAMVQPLRDNYGNIPAIIDGKYWSPFNTAEQNLSARYPRLTSVSKGNNYATSDFWIFDGGYFRLKNITLGYTVPDSIIRKVGLKKLRLYFSASDLLCFSNYPDGWDPEMGTSSYPITTSLLFGLSLNF